MKRAEELLRQGNLEAAIAAYVALTSANPADWSSLNVLGDLYVRAGQVDRAVLQFGRAGEQLTREGELAKAAAVYRKVLRLSPTDVRARRGLESVSASQQGAARASRAARPANDPDAKIDAAREAQDAEQPDRACALLIEAADLYQAQDRLPDALAAVAEASSVDPGNLEYRLRLLQMLIALGELVQARSVARSGSELAMVADALQRAGRSAEASDTLEDAVAAEGDNVVLRHRALRQLVTAGELDRARRLARAGEDLRVIAEALHGDVTGGETIDATGPYERAAMPAAEPRPEAALESARRDLEAGRADAAFAAIEEAADAAMAAETPQHALRLLRDFTDAAPDHIAGLLKLIEICVDRRLKGLMTTTQERLADAYLRAGRATEARLVAEDLVLRAPWERAYVERLLRSLVLCRDQEPEQTIADMLCRDSAFPLEDA